MSALQPVFQQAWSKRIESPLRGLALAREKGWLLTRDENDWLYLFDRKGNRQGQTRSASPLVAMSIADDGSCCAAVNAGGELLWLAPDLTVRWQRQLSRRPTAIALDPHGQYLALADVDSQIILFTRSGKQQNTVRVAHPLHHLAFIPERPFLIGCGDYGLAVCLDVQGNILWRDGFVAHCGSLSVSGNGSRIALACFSEGLRWYNAELGLDSKRRIAVPEAVRFGSLSYRGDCLLTAGLSKTLYLLSDDGRTLGNVKLDQEIRGIAIGPLGAFAAAALADGRVVAYHLHTGSPSPAGMPERGGH